MDNSFLDVIQTIGLSGALMCAACYFVKYMFDKFMSELSAERESHNEEMSKVTDAVNNNTIAITQLSEFLKKED